MKKIKIFLVGGEQYLDYLNFIPYEYNLVSKVKDSSLVFFCGGHDCWPVIYNHPIHPTTGFSIERDLYEKKVFDEAVSLKKKLWGCCRGSQAICCYQKNGFLIQHSNHPSFHEGIIEESGEKLWLTSSHHQMIAPEKLNHKILVYADNLCSYKYLGDGTNYKMNKEPEITYFPDIQGVATQSHVEWQFGLSDDRSIKTVKYHQDLMIKLIKEEL